METRKLGGSDLHPTVVGLGTWAHGGGGWAFGWGPQEDTQSEDTILAALETGVNWVDTAAVYGLGHAEEVLGAVLQKSGRRPIVATKCGLVWDSRGRISNCLTADSVRAECDASLKRLKTDRIDLYQIHWPMPDEQIEEGWAALADLIREGKVRYGGVSNFSVRQLQRAQAIHPVTSLQPPYSMLRREIEADLLPYCRSANIGVVAYSPLQKGLLTGKITAEYVAAMPADDHRKRDPMFRNPQLAAILGQLDQLKLIADRKPCTLSQLAIAWVVAQPGLTAAIAGARRPSDIRDTANAARVSLSAGELAEIGKILETEIVE